MVEEVIVEVGAPPEEVAAVEEVFREAGFEENVEAAVIRRSAGDLPWIIHVTLGVGLGAYIATFASEAAKDHYAAFTSWIKRLLAARRESGDGSIWLEDPEGTSLILSTHFPEEALDALAEIDWDDVRGGYLLWDADQGWFDQLKRH